MGKSCAAPGCTSGYRFNKGKKENGAQNQENPKVTIFAFPKNEELYSKWISAIPRKDWKPSKNMGVCELHFHPSDFQTERTDSKSRRSTKLGDLQRKRLQENAVPKVFPNCPNYLTQPEITQRTNATTAQSRFEKESASVELEAEEFLLSDNVTTVEDIISKIENDAIPTGVSHFVNSSNELVFLSMQFQDTDQNSLQFCLRIEPNLKFHMYVKGIKVDSKNIRHITTSDILTSCSQVTNIIACLKNIFEGSNIRDEDLIEHCAQILNKLSTAKRPNIEFLIEQLNLLLKPANRRRYSPSLLSMAMLWLTKSSGLYEQIQKEGILILPTMVYLKRLSSALTVDFGFSNTTKKYLQARFECLEDTEKVVEIIIDEVYSSKRVEFVGGKFYGNENDDITKTLLCVMIKSVGGKYKDIVALQPIASIDSSKIKDIASKVLEGTTNIGFDVVAKLVDGHKTNVKYYKHELCSGVLTTSISHPFKDNDRIFLLFNSVHVFKNIYTNLLKKGAFDCPAFENFPKCMPKFSHIRKLYNIELGKRFKIAHKLSDKCLSPLVIERSNVALADAVFHESTINGLEHYSKDYPEFQETAKFLKIIRRWWNIVNLKSPFVGEQKRDDNRYPISILNSAPCEYLNSFANWLQNWQDKSSKELSLSSETFLTSKQTSRALAELADYLLTVKGFLYVLLGLAQSDALEGRFGWYRQLSGANYFASVRQFLEAEKIIRMQSLIKFSGLNLSEIQQVFVEVSTVREEELNESVSVMLEELCDFQFDAQSIESDDQSILYYISGFVSRSVLKQVKCTSCSDLISIDKSSPDINFDSSETTTEEENIAKTQFLDSINRGGLVKPSDLMFVVSGHAHELLQKIFNEKELKGKFLKFGHPRDVFVKLFCKSIESQESTSLINEIKCSNGHAFSKILKKVATKMFNLSSKNYTSEINSTLHASRKRDCSGASKKDKAARKIQKLQSE